MKKSFLTLLLLFFLPLSAFSDEIIKLPIPKSYGNTSLEESIYHRRSERSFLPTALSREQISQLLWACQGITDPQWNFRSAPSAGALYPLEIYMVNDKGVYRYIPLEHKLIKIANGDRRLSVARASLAQGFIAEAPINLIISAVYSRSRAKFGVRADRYVHLEAGMAAENLLLQATAMGLSAISIGSFWDDVVAASLLLPPDHEPLLIIPVGYTKK